MGGGGRKDSSPQHNNSMRVERVFYLPCLAPRYYPAVEATTWVSLTTEPNNSLPSTEIVLPVSGYHKFLTSYFQTVIRVLSGC